MPKDRVDVVCPCCRAKLLVNSKTGLVIRSEARKSDYSFEKAVEQEKQRHAKTDQAFADAFEKEKQRRSTLDQKFEEALKSKDDLDEPAPRPFDLD